MSNSTFGSRATALLEKKHPGKPMRLVAEETGLNIITLKKALNDETSPRYATIRALGYYLDCPVKYLVDGEGSDKVVRPKKKPAPKANGGRGRPKGSGPRQTQFIEIVEANPGINTTQIAKQMGIRRNYLYRLGHELVQRGSVINRNGGYYVKGGVKTLGPGAQAAPEPKPNPKRVVPAGLSATGAAVNAGYREGYRDGYADAIRALAPRPMTVEELVA